MSFQKTFDIIIPIYNQEKYLNRCLDSILPQIDESIQVILVNDGSTDKSIDICREYELKYSNITVVNKENGGLSSARNAGLNVAASEFVVFVDSDDYVADDYVAWIKESADNKWLSLCSYVVRHINFGDSIVSCQGGTFDIKHAFCILQDSGLFNVAWNKIYSRELIEKEPKIRFQEGQEPAEDLLFNCEYFKRIDKVQISGVPHYFYMRNGEDTLANAYRKDLWEKNKFFIKTIENTFEELDIKDDEGVRALSLAVLNYVHSAIPNMYRPKHKFKRAERRGFYNEILNSEKIAFYFDNLNTEDKLLNNLKKIYNKNSAAKMDRYYSFLMFVRNNFSWLYNFIRRIKG